MSKSKRIKLSDQVFLEQWAHDRLGNGAFRDVSYQHFILMGIPDAACWDLTNKVRHYTSALAHYFDYPKEDVDANDKDVEANNNSGDGIYPIEGLLCGLIYKFGYEFIVAKQQEGRNITPLHRSQAFATAKEKLPESVRRVITEHTWSDQSLQATRRNFAESQFPCAFESVRTALFSEVDKAVSKAFATEQAALKHLALSPKQRKSQKICPDTQIYLDAVEDFKKLLRKQIGSET